MMNDKKKKSLLTMMFAEPDPKTQIQNEDVIKRKYAIFPILIFISLYILYFISYLGRKSITVALHPMQDASILDLHTYGIIMAVYYFTYAVGKFIGGIFADRANLRFALPASIGISSIITAGLAFSPDLYLNGYIQSKTFMLLLMYLSWGLAGLIQAAAFPLCAKALTFWFPNKNRSFVWSWWSTSHELGSAASLGIATVILQLSGKWQYVFYIPTIISIIVCILTLFTLRDKPVTLGLPNVEEYHQTIKKDIIKKDEPIDNRSYWQVFKEELLTNKNIWLMGFSFFFVYILRFGPMDWLPKQYMSNNEVGSIFKVLLIPIMGCIGTLTIPYVSKYWFKNRRAPATFTYLMVGALMLIVFRLTTTYGDVTPIIDLSFNPTLKNIVDFFTMSFIGISTYGPLVLIGGIASIENASKRVASAATGFTGSMGYVGAIISSLFLSDAIDKYGFSITANFWIISAIVGACLCIPMWKVTSSKDYSH